MAKALSFGIKFWKIFILKFAINWPNFHTITNHISADLFLIFKHLKAKPYISVLHIYFWNIFKAFKHIHRILIIVVSMNSKGNPPGLCFWTTRNVSEFCQKKCVNINKCVPCRQGVCLKFCQEISTEFENLLIFKNFFHDLEEISTEFQNLLIFQFVDVKTWKKFLLVDDLDGNFYWFSNTLCDNLAIFVYWLSKTIWNKFLDSDTCFLTHLLQNEEFVMFNYS